METYEYETSGAPFNAHALEMLLHQVDNEAQQDEIRRKLDCFDELTTDTLNALSTDGECAGAFVHDAHGLLDFYFQFTQGLGEGHGLLEVFTPKPWYNPLNQLTLEGALRSVDNLVMHKPAYPQLFNALSIELKRNPHISHLSDAETLELVAYLNAQ